MEPIRDIKYFEQREHKLIQVETVLSWPSFIPEPSGFHKGHIEATHGAADL